MIICFACSEGGLQYTHSIFFPFYLVLNGFPKYLHFVQMQLWPSRRNWRRSQNANCIHTKKNSDKLTSWSTASQNLSHISENCITNSLNNKSTTKFFTPVLSLCVNVHLFTVVALSLFHLQCTSTIHSNLPLRWGSWKRRDLYVGLFCSRVCTRHICSEKQWFLFLSMLSIVNCRTIQLRNITQQCSMLSRAASSQAATLEVLTDIIYVNGLSLYSTYIISMLSRGAPSSTATPEVLAKLGYRRNYPTKK